MPYRAEESSFAKKNQVNNFGKTERINGLKWFTFINVDIDEQMDWTLVFDTKSIVVDEATGVISGRVVAKVEVGSGNGYTETIWDVTDLVAIPIAGNHVKVALTLVSTFEIAPAPTPEGYEGSDLAPAPAPPEAAALVSAYLSADFAQSVFPSAVDHHVVPVFGAGTSWLGTAGVAATVPVRLIGLTAINPGPNPIYLFLTSNASIAALMIGPGLAAELVKKIIVLPPNLPVEVVFAASVPFDRGLVWVASDTLAGITQSVQAIRVDLELVRRPTVKTVSTIAPTG